MLLLNDTVSPLRRHIRASPMSQRQPARSMRHVALLIESSGSYGRGLLSGIARYNRQQGGWSTYFRPLGLSDGPPQWLRQWDGDGILVRSTRRELIDLARRSRLPTVNLRLGSAEPDLPSVIVDDNQIARLAWQHLRDRG